MKHEDFNKIVERINTERVKLMVEKSSDYDKDIDRLASFKQVATICRVLDVDCRTGSGVATVLFILKIVRDANLKNSGKEVKNESRDDTLIDMHNYIDLKSANELDEMIDGGK